MWCYNAAMARLPLFSPEGLSPALELAELVQGDVAGNIDAAEGILSDYSFSDFRADLTAAPLERRPTELQLHDRVGHGRVKRLLAHSILTDAVTSYGIWAHQYLSDSIGPVPALSAHPAMRRHHKEGERWHTHTGPLVARLIRGGYIAGEKRRTESYRPLSLQNDDIGDWEEFADSLRPQEITYGSEDGNRIMSIDPDEIHRLVRVGRGTISIVIKFGMRDYSLLFNATPAGRLTVYRTLPSGFLTPDKVPVDERMIPDLPLLRDPGQ
jgi:hypothetical protein